MSQPTDRQRKSRADAPLDHKMVADLPFFSGPNRTKKHKAAIYLAEGFLSDRAISQELNISRTTLHEWKQDADFTEAVAEYEREIRAEALQFAIASKIDRLRGYDELNTRYWQIIHERSERHAAEVEDTPDNAMRGVFGDSTPREALTGMLVRQPKIAANGKTVVEWAFDKPLDSAIKENYKQAAQELGQWDEKTTVDMQNSVSVIRIVGED